MNSGDVIGSTAVAGAYNQGSGATLHIDIQGTTLVTRYDQLQVSGTASLSGVLDVVPYDGFAPSAADTYQVVTAGSVSGAFANAAAGAGTLVTPFGTWDVADSSTGVTLSNFAADPFATVASIGALNGFESEVLGGSAAAGGLDVSFTDEVGIFTADFDTVADDDLDDLINNCDLDFDTPTFALPAISSRCGTSNSMARSAPRAWVWCSATTTLA